MLKLMNICVFATLVIASFGSEHKIQSNELIYSKQAKVQVLQEEFLRINFTNSDSNYETYTYSNSDESDTEAIQCLGDIYATSIPGKCFTVVDLSNAVRSSGNSEITNNAPEVFPVGDTNVTFFANGDSCSIVVSVKDVEPPKVLEVQVSKNVLWPPNFQFHTVDVDVIAWDNCASTTSEIHCAISDVSQNEDSEWIEMEGGPYCGVGGATFDIFAPLAVNLCAERNFRGSGRVYTISGFCKDDQNDSVSPFETQVTVPVSIQ